MAITLERLIRSPPIQNRITQFDDFYKKSYNVIY